MGGDAQFESAFSRIPVVTVTGLWNGSSKSAPADNTVTHLDRAGFHVTTQNGSARAPIFYLMWMAVGPVTGTDCAQHEPQK